MLDQIEFWGVCRPGQHVGLTVVFLKLFLFFWCGKIALFCFEKLLPPGGFVALVCVLSLKPCGMFESNMHMGAISFFENVIIDLFLKLSCLTVSTDCPSIDSTSKR